MILGEEKTKKTRLLFMSAQDPEGTASERNVRLFTFLSVGRFLEYHEVRQRHTFTHRFTDSPADKQSVYGCKLTHILSLACLDYFEGNSCTKEILHLEFLNEFPNYRGAWRKQITSPRPSSAELSLPAI